MVKGYVISYIKLKNVCRKGKILQGLLCLCRKKDMLRWVQMRSAFKIPECTEKLCPVLKTCESEATVWTMYGQ